MELELSFFHLLSDATLPVQAVLAVLLLASVILWAAIVQRGLVYRAVRQSDAHFEAAFWSGGDIRDLYNEIEEVADVCGLESIFQAGFAEYIRLREHSKWDTALVVEGVQRSMRVRLTQEQVRLERYLGLMATVGSTAPYVGLLGTVWGIMNAFRELAGTQQSTLATVAPGIAEALIATAMGLFAAIPAVVAYNYYTGQSHAIVSTHHNFMDEFVALLYRQAGLREAGAS